MIATITTTVHDAAQHRALLFSMGVLVAVALLIVLVGWARRRIPAGTPWFYYLASVGGLAVSLNTSWRFFGQRLGITGAERVIMFSVVELALIACALGMRANVRTVDPATGRPAAAGAPRLVAWVLCGLSAYAALLLSGPVEGIARVALGPTLSLVMLHLALGIEIRNRTAARSGTWTRIAVEMRERMLSRLGLADDHRDARARTQERAARRVARLALGSRTPLRTARLSRALRASNVAHDPQTRERMLDELAVLRYASELADLTQASPWAVVAASPSSSANRPSSLVRSPSATASRSGAPVRETSGDGEHERPAYRRERTDRAEQPRAEQLERAGRTGRSLPVGGDTDTGDIVDGAEADGKLLAEQISLKGASGTSKNAAIDFADSVLPDRTPRALVAALAHIGVDVAESSVRRQRSERAEQPSGSVARKHAEREHATL
jgi:hypothetical protein